MFEDVWGKHSPKYIAYGIWVSLQVQQTLESWESKRTPGPQCPPSTAKIRQYERDY